MGGYFSGQKMEIPGIRQGLCEIPSMVGVWIFSGTTQYKISKTKKYYHYILHNLVKTEQAY